MPRLNERQKRFVDYFIELGNATQAAIRAGYSEKTANRTGSENLSKPYIRAYIDKRLLEIESERIASAEEVMRFLTSTMRGEVRETVPILCGNGYQELKEKDPGVKERLKAAELLGKRYGVFTENISVDTAVTIVDDVPEADDG